MGTSLLRFNAYVASSFTYFDSTERSDHITITHFDSFNAFSITSLKRSLARSFGFPSDSPTFTLKRIRELLRYGLFFAFIADEYVAHRLGSPDKTWSRHIYKFRVLYNVKCEKIKRKRAKAG